jgi:hypothetical protein
MSGDDFDRGDLFFGVEVERLRDGGEEGRSHPTILDLVGEVSARRAEGRQRISLAFKIEWRVSRGQL